MLMPVLLALFDLPIGAVHLVFDIELPAIWKFPENVPRHIVLDQLGSPNFALLKRRASF